MLREGCFIIRRFHKGQVRFVTRWSPLKLERRRQLTTPALHHLNFDSAGPFDSDPPPASPVNWRTGGAIPEAFHG